MPKSGPLLSRLLRHLLPGACLLCDQALPPDADLDLCRYCLASLPWNEPACPRCALPLVEPDQPDQPSEPAEPGELGEPPQREQAARQVQRAAALRLDCPQCRSRPPPFTAALAPLRYEGCARIWIAALKDRLGLVEGRLLGLLMAEATAGHYGEPDGAKTRRDPNAAAAAAPTRPDLLIPVPLSPWRLARRGHNQALTLALPVARRLKIPVLRHAVARRGGGHQRGRTRSQRLEASASAFVGRRSWPEPGPCVAIIDDVLTTGATAAALARVLLSAGAREVQVIAAARTPNRTGPAGAAMG